MTQTGFEAKSNGKWATAYTSKTGPVIPKGLAETERKISRLGRILKNSQTRRNSNAYTGLRTPKKMKPGEKE